MRSAMRWARQAAAVVRRVIGVPDYEAYLLHMRQRHPQSVPLSRDRFLAEQLRAKYERPGSRCC